MIGHSRTVVFALAVAAMFVMAGGPHDGASAAEPDDITVAEAVRFRSDFGLRSDKSWVVETLANDTLDSETWGVPLTPAELATMADRARIGESLEPMLLYGEAHPKTFGGLYIDNQDDGTIVVLVTDDQGASEWRERAPEGATVRLRRVDRTLAKLDSIHQSIVEEWSALDRQGVEIASIVTVVPDNTVEVRVIDYARARASDLTDRFGPGVRVVPGKPITSSACPDSNCANPLRAGIKISGPHGNCTSGFHVRGYGGNIKMLTAGHCNYGSPIGTGWSHSGFGSIGNFVESSYSQDSRADSGLIDIPNGQGSKLFFISIAQGNRSVTAVQNKTQEATGQIVCRSGFKSGYSCGTLQSVNVSTRDTDTNIRLVHQRMASVSVQPGDSGAPIFYGTTAKGNAAARDNDTGWVIYTHIKEAKDALGWDHLCGMNGDNC
jgi:hypothetical protein